MTISAIVLAAGRSARFRDGNKMLADVAGQPMIRRVLEAVAASKVQEILLVTGKDGSRIVAAAGPGRWRAVSNPEPELGLSSSIRVGLAAVDANAKGVLIVLGDMPGVSSTLIDALIATFESRARSAIVYPVSGEGHQGHPVLWPAALFDELKALTGDTGAKALLSKYAHLVITIPVADGAPFLDIDTVEDLSKLKLGDR